MSINKRPFSCGFSISPLGKFPINLKHKFKYKIRQSTVVILEAIKLLICFILSQLSYLGCINTIRTQHFQSSAVKTLRMARKSILIFLCKHIWLVKKTSLYGSLCRIISVVITVSVGDSPETELIHIIPLNSKLALGTSSW